MKKVLILAYDFYPYNSVGAQRPLGWFKYLKKYGYKPIVVTRHWDTKINNPLDCAKPSFNKHVKSEENEEGIIIRVPFNPNLRDKLLLKYGINRMKFLRKLLTIFNMLFEYFIPFFDSKFLIFKTCKSFLKENEVDLIIATGEPFILFKYAKKLSSIYNVPWFADYRDGWSTNYNRMVFERFFYKRIESEIVKSASMILTVSKEFKAQLQKLFPNKSIEVIYNGFFEEKFKKVQDTNTKVFKIGFAGTLYDYQPIEMFAEGLKNFYSSSKAIEIVFVGIKFYENQHKRVQKVFKKFKNILVTTERISQEEAINELSSCSLLLLPASPNYPQVYAKVFDYIGLNKNILFFYDDKATLSDILKETGLGVFCNNSYEITKALDNCYDKWEQKGNNKELNNFLEFSRNNQTRLFAKLINNYLKNN